MNWRAHRDTGAPCPERRHPNGLDVLSPSAIRSASPPGAGSMRVVLQRVSHANVTVEGRVTGAIGRGLLVLAGAAADDTAEALSA